MSMNSNTTIRPLSILVCSIGLCLTSLPSKAAVSGSSADNGNGTFTYSYIVDNSGGSFDVVDFALDFNFPNAQIDWNQLDVAGGGEVTVANGNWIAEAGIPVIGLSSQDFLSIAPAGDVQVGSSLSGFSFVSALAPGTVAYFEFGALGESAFGSTVGPAVLAGVPDGSSCLTLLSISLGLVASGRRRFISDWRA